MREELEKKLVEKYPKIFRYVTEKTKLLIPMVFGMECEDGWYWLIDNLCKSLQWDTDKNKHSQIVAMQVKEKWGGLCFYVNGSDDKQNGMISLAESLSQRICEVCGSCEGKECYRGLWQKTLCKKCAEELGYEIYS